jgi:hypothetical protein
MTLLRARASMYVCNIKNAHLSQTLNEMQEKVLLSVLTFECQYHVFFDSNLVTVTVTGYLF